MVSRLMHPFAKPNNELRVSVESSAQSQPHPSARLRRISTAVHSGLAPDSNDMHWMASALDRILNGEPADAALGIKRRSGQRSFNTITALDQRDRLFREAAKRFLGGMSINAQAHRLHEQLSRYQSSAWTRERVCEACPDRHQRTIYEFLWRALKSHDHVLSARSLRDVLAKS
jgi:hypothetical protein